MFDMGVNFDREGTQVSRVVEQQGFTCEVLFDERSLVVVSFARDPEPGGGSVLAGYWVVFDQPADLLSVVAAVRRAWWMRGVGSFELGERSECEQAITELFDVDDVNKVASVRMTLGWSIPAYSQAVKAHLIVVGSVWRENGRRHVDAGSAGDSVLPFEADDVEVAEALRAAMEVSNGASRR